MHSYQYEDSLESERLVTRKLTLDDVPAWSEFFTTPETTEFLKVHVLDTPEQSATQWIERQMIRYVNHEYGLQGLFDRKEGHFIGLCGLIRQEVEGHTEIEVGYHVLKRHWGKGYAPEAAKLFLNYGFDHGVSDSLVSLIDINNIKSQRVADKNGLTRGRQARYKDFDVYIYRIHQSEWIR
jgi:ribosomal-protein-alanine N-acetyltransferase